MNRRQFQTIFFLSLACISFQSCTFFGIVFGSAIQAKRIKEPAQNLNKIEAMSSYWAYWKDGTKKKISVLGFQNDTESENSEIPTTPLFPTINDSISIHTDQGSRRGKLIAFDLGKVLIQMGDSLAIIQNCLPYTMQFQYKKKYHSITPSEWAKSESLNIKYLVISTENRTDKIKLADLEKLEPSKSFAETINNAQYAVFLGLAIDLALIAREFNNGL